MILIVCLDDQLGMMFNRRRQSRDRVLIAEMLASAGERRLVVSPYSAPLFPADTPNLSVADDPCAAALTGDLAFVENTDPLSHRERVTELWIYRWNRIYPADRRFDGDLTGFRLTETTEFVGSSHDKITKEVWKLC